MCVCVFISRYSFYHDFVCLLFLLFLLLIRLLSFFHFFYAFLLSSLLSFFLLSLPTERQRERPNEKESQYEGFNILPC